MKANRQEMGEAFERCMESQWVLGNDKLSAQRFRDTIDELYELLSDNDLEGYLDGLMDIIECDCADGSCLRCEIWKATDPSGYQTEMVG